MTGQTGHLGSLEDIVEPDDNLLRETEAESTIPPVRRAIVVLVSDSAMDSDDRTGDLVTELLSEDNFEVDGVVSVAAKRSTIRTAIETAVVGGADLVEPGQAPATKPPTLPARYSTRSCPASLKHCGPQVWRVELSTPAPPAVSPVCPAPP